jgi:hypothetical protein
MSMRDIMTRLSGEKPIMWGDSIVGFGEYRSTGATGSSSTWMRTGFSPRKQALTLYIMDGFDSYESLLEQLGPHRTGRACLYITDLEKVDLDVLERIISGSLDHIAGGDDIEGA